MGAGPRPLFAEAATALTAAIVEDVKTIEPLQDVEIEVPGEDRSYLLLDWLSAILLKFEMDHLLFREFRVTVGPKGLTAKARGEPFDPHGII